MRCENLDVWKRASKLSAEIYIYFKDCNDFGFKDQITRSGLSIASNIAEGVERFSNQETIRFLDIARASGAELMTQIYIGMKINYINKDIGMQWKKEIEEIAKMITTLIKKYKDYT
jgi:four helix bundle protein